MTIKKKCKNCGEQRYIEHEFVSSFAKVCVFCNDKGITDENYNNVGLGLKKEPETIQAISKTDRGGMKFYTGKK